VLLRGGGDATSINKHYQCVEFPASSGDYHASLSLGRLHPLNFSFLLTPKSPFLVSNPLNFMATGITHHQGSLDEESTGGKGNVSHVEVVGTGNMAITDHDIIGEKAQVSDEEVFLLQQLTPEEKDTEKKLRRRIDFLIMSLVIIVYMLNYIDR
jgi:hypothetical protein